MSELPINQNKETEEKLKNNEHLESLRALGATCLKITVDASVLRQHRDLLENPNSFSGASMFTVGDIPTEADKVYRQVHIEAIKDLAKTGIVRNGATASGRENRRWGHRVFWNAGKEGTAVNTGGRVVIVASKEAASKGWVTSPDIHEINVKTDDGKIVNILEDINE